MSGDYLSNRMLDSKIKQMRKDDLRYFQDADEFDEALQKFSPASAWCENSHQENRE
jgi:hypothetical protein